MEESAGRAKKSHKNLIIGIVVFVLVGVGVALLLWQLFKGNETYESGSGSGESIGSLYCVSANPSDAFFASSRAIGAKHEIKITFRGDKADKISYTYTGEYESEAMAEQDNATLHANYNIYMGEHKASAESLTPTFSTIDNAMKINLFAKRSSLNNAVAKLFFLSSDEAAKLGTYSDSTIQSIYKSKGFSCELKK